MSQSVGFWVVFGVFELKISTLEAFFVVLEELLTFLEKEIKTTRYSIHRWTKYENGQEHHLGYEGEHHLFVEFKIDNERINKIIDEVSTKVPCVSINISYSCSHLEKYDKKLIELAIKDAKSKATIIAKASNVNLKQIKTIKVLYHSK